MRGRDETEKGAVAITVAISMLVLLGFAALAIDGGLGFDDRRGTQNAADNAALAAAWEACNPANSPADPTGAALAVAAENGYDDTAAETSVTVTSLSASEYEVVIQTDNDATFAPAGVGAETVTVTSRAVATCEEEPFLGGYAIFAGAEHCSNGGSIELDLSGSTKTVNGGIFSNGDMKITGSDTTVNGPVEYRGTFTGSDVDEEKYFGSPKGYPLDLSIDDFGPGGWYRSTYPSNFFDAAGNQIDNNWMTSNNHATGNNSSIEITRSGIYYTSFSGNQDAIDLKQVTAAPGVTVTFVSEGSIQIVGNGDLTGFAAVNQGGYSPLLFFSNAGSPPACNTDAIKFSGSGLTWTGLVYAPNGEVKFSASAVATTTTFSGSIIANTVDVSASNFEINWQDDGAGEPRFIVELNE